MFGCKVFFLNTKDNLSKFSIKTNERILVAYSNTSKAYRVYNNKTYRIEESRENELSKLTTSQINRVDELSN